MVVDAYPNPTLLAAQRSASAVPYLKVVVSDRVGGIKRLAWTRLYTGAEPDGYHAAAMAGDGSLIRARVTGGHVYYQRVTNPGAGSNFAAWTDLGAAANADVALCADGSRVLLFYVDAGGTQVKVRESTDNGATLGAAVTAATAGGAVTWLAADVKASGDVVLLYSVGATVFSAKQTAGAWGSPAAWTNTAASITGLACYHHGDWNARRLRHGRGRRRLRLERRLRRRLLAGRRHVVGAARDQPRLGRLERDVPRAVPLAAEHLPADLRREVHRQRRLRPALPRLLARHRRLRLQPLARARAVRRRHRLRAGDRLRRHGRLAEHAVRRLDRPAARHAARRHRRRRRVRDARPPVRRPAAPRPAER